MFDLFDSWHELVTIAIILAGWALSWALITLCHLMQPSGRRWSYNSTTKGLHLNSRRWPKQSCALQFNLAGLLIILLAFARRMTKLLPLKLFKDVWRLKRFWKPSCEIVGENVQSLKTFQTISPFRWDGKTSPVRQVSKATAAASSSKSHGLAGRGSEVWPILAASLLRERKWKKKVAFIVWKDKIHLSRKLLQ